MVIGVIGGIGAGKSTVLQILTEQYHMTAYRSDDLAKTMYHPGHPVYDKMVETFGREILDSMGDIDRGKLAKLLFGHPERIEQVNQIVHPAVWAEISRLIRESREAQQDIVIETALPAEQFLRDCDSVWYVHTEEATRIARIMESRGYTREEAEKRISAQRSDTEFRDAADFVLDNSGTKEETIHEICQYFQRL